MSAALMLYPSAADCEHDPGTSGRHCEICRLPNCTDARCIAVGGGSDEDCDG